MSVVLAGRTGCGGKPHVGVALGQVSGCLFNDFAVPVPVPVCLPLARSLFLSPCLPASLSLSPSHTLSLFRPVSLRQGRGKTYTSTCRPVVRCMPPTHRLFVFAATEGLRHAPANALHLPTSGQ